MRINEMQRRLATWTATDNKRRFDRLLRVNSHLLWLSKAAEITLSSKEANKPGVDSIKKYTLQEVLNDYLNEIINDLLSVNYRPSMARRIYIQKDNVKQRPIRIPTLRYRIIQRVMLMTMKPIWENVFQSLSYGFRQERSVHHTFRTVRIQLIDSSFTIGHWVTEGVLLNYFDPVIQRLLMNCVHKRISCKQFNNLFWLFIKAGYIDKNLFCSTSQEVPQGGIISPLILKIMLNEFDQYLDKQYQSEKACKDCWYCNHIIKIEGNLQLKKTDNGNRQFPTVVLPMNLSLLSKALRQMVNLSVISLVPC